MKKLTFVFIALAGMALFARPTFAQYYNQPTGTQGLVLDKKVRSLSTTDFKDNYLFSNDSLIEFSVKVENTTGASLNAVEVKDMLPKYLKLIFFPGSFDTKTNEISWKIDELKSKEAKTYTIRAKVESVPSVASSSAASTIKLTNTASAKAGNLSDSDTATFYVGQKKVPETGAEDMLIKTIIAAAVLASGVAGRKYVRGY